MASIKALKKEINYVLGELIEAVYEWESEAGNQIIDNCIEVYDELIDLVNDKENPMKKDHFKKVNEYLEKKANEIADQINSLGD